ncbi:MULTISPECIES: endonuclease MutS2 [Ignavibacterium]|uniref:endonuclease MutS2 n=1 Tax=Ignavibacterium TaxID=795750 RepID=UPI0025C693F0|nr:MULTISPECIES: endonuclease MutS2 [Ignavibacterium]MBI5662881.1 endonuclease MutS2 [Ignavibacterium album]
MIDKSVAEKLEFDKILKHISGYCVTEKGKTSVLNLFPVTDFDEINSLGRIVEEAKSYLIKHGNIQIDYSSDLSESLYQSRIEGAILSTKKILEIRNLARTSRLLQNQFNKERENLLLLNKVAEKLYSDRLFEYQIEKIITEDGEVKESASKTLAEIRKEIRVKKDELIKSINRIVKTLKEEDIVREDYLTLRDGRMVIPVKAEHKRHIRGFIHSESSTGQTVYIEPEETLELNNDIVSLSFSERREIERLLRELTRLVGQNSAGLISAFENITFIDTVFARANYSLEIVGSYPGINNNNPFHIIEGRHPLLIKKLGRTNTVPLNLKLVNDRVVIITGPNAGGKTVVLKTIGLLTLMLQSGIHIPVHPDSNFHLFKKVLIDIGDQQSIEDDLSTFSSHLKNLNHILNEADNQSLILLDEIGTGTDPSEGASLAAAILKKLLEKGSLVFASTHHGSLKLFAYNVPGMVNAAMQFNHETLSPTYVFRLGTPGSSYAFQIAERIGLQKDVIDEAEKLMDSEKHTLEKFISEVEAKSNELEKKLAELEKENIRLKGLSNLYKQSYDKLEKEKKEIIRKARSDAGKYLEDVNRKVEKVIKEIKESSAEKNIIKAAKKTIEELKTETEIELSAIREESNSKEEFTEGDFVQIKNSNAVGRIIEIDLTKKKATVLIGSIKMLVKLSDLIPAKEVKETKSHDIHDFIKTPQIAYRLDIRGKRADEAEYEIIKFVDDAYQAGLDRAEILHGKGTGALKKLVKDILSSHSGVKNFYYAPVEQGGDGITIIEFN